MSDIFTSFWKAYVLSTGIQNDDADWLADANDDDQGKYAVAFGDIAV